MLYGKEGRENRKEVGGVLGGTNDTLFSLGYARVEDRAQERQKV